MTDRDEWAWYYEGGSIQADGYPTREAAIASAVLDYEADVRRVCVGRMADVDAGGLVDADGWIDDTAITEAARLLDVERLVERAEDRHYQNVEDGRVFLAHPFSKAEASFREWVDEYVMFTLRPGAQEALEEWARDNLSPDPSRCCDGDRLSQLEQDAMGARSKPDTEPRPCGCKCHWEAGDSPCPVHGGLP